MNRPKLFMMCGLVGSGKSYKAKELAERYDAKIHSSDFIREELTGDINNQDINEISIYNPTQSYKRRFSKW